MSRIILWLQLIGLKQIRKKLITFGKAMNRFAVACNKDEFYAVTGHRIDLSMELDLMRDVVAGLGMNIS